jgi:hypothetical protein
VAAELKEKTSASWTNRQRSVREIVGAAGDTSAASTPTIKKKKKE